MIKNVSATTCINAAWSQIGTTNNYENKWFEGRPVLLDSGCGWGFKFVPLPQPITTTQSSSSSTSSQSSISMLGGISNSNFAWLNALNPFTSVVASAETDQEYCLRASGLVLIIPNPLRISDTSHLERGGICWL